jgi:hypothetical protein
MVDADLMVSQLHNLGLGMMKRQNMKSTGISWIDKQKNSLYKNNTLYVLNTH